MDRSPSDRSPTDRFGVDTLAPCARLIRLNAPSVAAANGIAAPLSADAPSFGGNNLDNAPANGSCATLIAWFAAAPPIPICIPV
ncbi:hypothetical protein CLV71_1081 [Actinophytocola oryzae]|uniref:Uncharacterized protein n=1 Tax=Actinophytocola oryzae TaxID=502181 RepID=A0A4V6Q6R8_9PSEU|nr:hypothetical protein CLV71_1081 [Actinophytocola oryzae]